jgi:uncharacterized protein YqhQ
MTTHNRPTYGGQAVIEGVMIRGQRHASVAVRRPDGTLAIKCEPLSQVYTGLFRKIPVLRGILVLAEMMTLGMRALMYSARVGAEAEGEEIGKGAMAATIAFSVTFAIGLFFLLPVLASRSIEGLLDSEILSNLVEGAIRMILFIAYIYLIGRMSEIRRVFMYHGAEHMTVHAQERDDSLDIASIRQYSTAHPRCGTAFLLTVMVVAIVVFTFVGRDPLWWLIVSRIVLIPVVAAISYEIIRFSGFHSSSPLVRLITVPNLALQSLTTREPDDEQIAVAVAAMDSALKADAQHI